MDKLAEIIKYKRNEIEAQKRDIPIDITVSLERPVSRRPFRELFDKGAVLIAEIKPKSPSAGEIISIPPLTIADAYAKSDADALSVLTDKKYFGGDLDLLKAVRARVPQAVLRKDFIIDEYQVYETHLSGADAFLLIAAALDSAQLGDLITLGKTLRLDALVEVHDERDLEKAIESGADLIGINNRNLKTLETDLAVTERLAPRIPSEIPFISESGVETSEDVKRVRSCGARGILVGTSILRSGDYIEKISELKKALT